jgi:hypothetical protein
MRLAFASHTRVSWGIAFKRLMATVPILLLVAGCGREEVRVYRVAKETQAPASAPNEAASMPPGHPDAQGAPPRLTWKLPAGWEELPAGEMRLASFLAKSKDGKLADISIVPLPGSAGGVLNNVNRWRGQVGQAPVTEEELTRIALPIEIAGEPSQLYEQASTAQDPSARTNILAAILNHDGIAWFFKMTGNAALVTEQKPVFIEFLKSLKFQAPAAQEELPAGHPPIAGANTPPPQTASTDASTDDKPKWHVPSGWQEAAAGQFLVAKFLISGENTSQAAVNISAAGGELSGNVNRWRGQLALAPLSREEIEKLVQPLAVPAGKAMLVDMHGTEKTGQKARLIGVIVSQPNQTWYYKLMGDEQIVEREKARFLEFVQTAIYP